MTILSERANQPLIRLIAYGRCVSSRLILGVLAGAAALAAGVGLTATAAWLIARASQMPPVLTLGVAVAAVRLCGIARPVLRYVGRLVSHDGALRLVADFRARVYERLIPLAPPVSAVAVAVMSCPLSSMTSTRSRI